MLWNVPKTVNRLTRNVVMNHPNSFNIEVFRKHTTRKGEKYFAGKPTLGGIGVIDSGDEVEYEFEYMGNGYALPAEPFQPGAMVDHKDTHVGEGTDFRFLIELECQTGSDDYFELRNHDVIYLLLGGEPGNEVKVAFEIVTMETTSNIPPYTVRYVCNRRDDLFLTPDMYGNK